jgi:hypothetical protein
VVKASGAGVQPAQSERVRLGPGEIREGIDIEMQPGGALPLEIVGANGDPSLGMIEARWAGKEKGVEPKNAFAGPSGKARLDGLRPGAWKITVRPLSIGSSGGQPDPVVREVEVKIGENEPVRITLP